MHTIKSIECIIYLNLNGYTARELHKYVTIFFSGFLGVLWINVH